MSRSLAADSGDKINQPQRRKEHRESGKHAAFCVFFVPPRSFFLHARTAMHSPSVTLVKTSHVRLIILTAIAWLWVIVAIPFLTDTGCHLFIGGPLALTWLGLGFTTFCSLFLMPETFKSLRGVCWWFLLFVALLVGLSLFYTQIGLKARVRLSEKSLENYVARVPAGTKAINHADQQVGLFLVDGIEERKGAVLLYTSDEGFLDRNGLAYIPDGVDPPTGVGLQHLFGPWYWFHWHF
jgi:hypothetical protein